MPDAASPLVTVAPRSLCVFCGSSPGTNPAHVKAAQRLGRILAENGVHLVFGAGGVGIMGAVAQACLDSGGTVTGIIPDHLIKVEAALPNLTELLIVPDMHSRKRLMFERSDAFCILPGGFGTMDETFEILTWKQLGLHSKPVVLADINGYWKPFAAFAESMLQEGFIRRANLGLFTIVERVEDVLPATRCPPGAPCDPAASALF